MGRIGAPVVRAAAALAALDAATLGATVANAREVPAFLGVAWDVNTDAGVLEVVAGAQVVVAAALLLRCRFDGRRPPVLVVWACVLLLVVVDDLAQLHERGSVALVAAGLPGVAGLPPREAGELATWGALALPAVVALVLAHRVSAVPARRAGLHVAAALALIACFSVVFDLGREAVEHLLPPAVPRMLGAVEATGETIGASVLLLVALHLVTAGLPRRSRITGVGGSP